MYVPLRSTLKFFISLVDVCNESPNVTSSADFVSFVFCTPFSAANETETKQKLIRAAIISNRLNMLIISAFRRDYLGGSPASFALTLTLKKYPIPRAIITGRI